MATSSGWMLTAGTLQALVDEANGMPARSR
jgi:hypothetical protein